MKNRVGNELLKKGYAFLIVLVISLSCNSLTAFADDILLHSGETPIFERIDRETELSNLSVSSIVQDKYGFLWFGTQSGLNYYDGLKITVYKKNPFVDDELLHNLIQTMYYDEMNHELWIGTYQGISRFTIESKSFQNYTVESNGLSNEVVVAITKDNQGNIWIGTLDGLSRLNPLTNEMTNFDIPGKVVRDLLIDSTGRLLIGSYEGLLYYDADSESVKNIELDLPSQYVMQVKEFDPGIITLGMWDGGTAVLDLDFKNMEVQNYDDNRIYSIYKTSDGTLWAGTWGGGLFATTQDGEQFHFEGDGEENALAHPIVYSMYQDSSNILWIGTNGGGISKVNPRKSNYVKYFYDPENPESLDQGKINKIYRDSADNLWVAIYNSGLNRFDETTNLFIKYSEKFDEPYYIPDNQVIDIIEPEKGILLFGTGNGILKYDIESDIKESMNILPEGTMVYSLEADDEKLWIGTYNEGVYLYQTQNDELIHYSTDDSENLFISDNLIYDILVDSQDRVWIGTNNGLNMKKPGEEAFNSYYRKPNDMTEIASNTIRCLFEDSKGRIWIGMVSGGVALYDEDDDSFRSYTEDDGMPGNSVVSISEGENGDIWLATLNGLAIITPETEKIVSLTPNDGVGFWEFNSGSFMEDDGTLLFGGIDGIAAIPSDLKFKNSNLPNIYITGIKVFQESLDPTKQFFNGSRFVFKSDESSLDFEYVALDYDAPEKMNFMHQLVGLDETWIDSDLRNYASYSNLPHGEYEFRVKAMTFRGVETETASVFFTIEKPWYITNAAYVLYAFLLFVLFAATNKLREAHILDQRNSELSNLNQKLNLANEELEKLSINDYLTGIFNRRYFDAYIKEQFDFARRSHTNLSLIMFDIDNFKAINDTFGHIAGDNILIKMTKEISHILQRNTDIIARYGGDEFIIVLYDTDLGGAQVIIKKIKEAYKNIDLVKDYSDKNVNTSLSFGVVSAMLKDESTPEQMLQAADEALYKAKEKGKDQLYIGKF